jgi:hypothetical protein
MILIRDNGGTIAMKEAQFEEGIEELMEKQFGGSKVPSGVKKSNPLVKAIVKPVEGTKKGLKVDKRIVK